MKNNGGLFGLKNGRFALFNALVVYYKKQNYF